MFLRIGNSRVNRPSFPVSRVGRRLVPWIVLSGILWLQVSSALSAVPMLKNAVFRAPVGNWGVGNNWNTGSVPGFSDYSVFVSGNNTARITAREPGPVNVYIGRGNGNGEVQMSGAGALISRGVYLGWNRGRYGLWYQTGGLLDTSYMRLGSARSTQGKFILKGGIVRVAWNVDVGRHGLGGFTVAGGTLHTGAVSVAAQAGSDYSYFNEAGGQVTVHGGVNVGARGLLDLSGGTFHWGGKLTVAGNGGTMEVMGPGATAKWTGRGGTALTIADGGILRFDLIPNGIGTLNLGRGKLAIDAGAVLVVDGSRFNFPGKRTRTFKLITSSGMAGESTFSRVEFVGFEDKSAWVSCVGGDVVLNLRPAPALSRPAVISAGTIEPNSRFDYMYAPSAMYDRTEGLYKVWTCYLTSSMTNGGDHIGYKEYPTLAGLAHAPTMTAMNPSGNPSRQDDVDACDPSVYRDPSTGIYYLAYDGNTQPDPRSHLPSATRIGIARSCDGGRTFTPLYTKNAATGYALIAPGPRFLANAYGTGQPAVVQADDGYWYMIYTDDDSNAPNSSHPNCVKVIRSHSPTFMKDGAADYTTVKSMPLSVVGNGSSLDMAYDPATKQFIVIDDNMPGLGKPIGDNSIELIWFNAHWKLIRSQYLTIRHQKFSFGEGVALLTNSRGRVLYPNLLTFFGATQDRHQHVWPYWIRGNFSYLNIVYW